MREILFRGKQENNEWAKGSLIIWGDGSCSIETGILTEPTASVIPETVGQFTGLTDKNGKKIFEGDIIEWNAEEFGRPYRELVEWDFKLLGFRQGDWGEWCKVIGNIHDNPELLGGADDEI